MTFDRWNHSMLILHIQAGHQIKSMKCEALESMVNGKGKSPGRYELDMTQDPPLETIFQSDETWFILCSMN